MRLAVIGAGYVGLVSGACFADFGHTVVCVDKDESKVAALRRGEIPIFEPGLDALVANNMRQGQLSFTTDIAEGRARRGGDLHRRRHAVAPRRRPRRPLLRLRRRARGRRGDAKVSSSFVTKSTVPVGTGDEVERIVREVNPSADFDVVSNPEFLREGSAINDFKRPDRIVIGASDARARALMGEIYRPLNLNKPPLLFVDRRTSELIKYAANAFLATKITFINEIADLCEKVGANVQDVAHGIGMDNRIGVEIPARRAPATAAPAFPKDTLALVKTGQDADAPMRHRRDGGRDQRSAQARACRKR